MTWSGKIAIIGAGQLGSALLEGLLAVGHDPAQIRVATRRPTHAAELAERHGVQAGSAAEAVQGASLVVLGARPGQILDSIDEVADQLADDAVVVSVAGGPEHAMLAAHLPACTPVVRAMPNTAMVIGSGFTAICPAPDCPPEAADRVRALFSELGGILEVTEDQIGAFGSLAGHGQAVVYYIADALEQWGVMHGFNRAESRQIVTAAISGAAEMLESSDETAAELQHRVCTPGGTTIRTVNDLDASGVRGAVIASIDGGRYAK